jgi:hypothetical protein
MCNNYIPVCAIITYISIADRYIIIAQTGMKLSQRQVYNYCTRKYVNIADR